MTRRVAITGIGIVSPFGNGCDAAREALRDGRSGVVRLTSIDTSELTSKIGGEVPAAAHEGVVKGYDRFTRFALIAAREAAAMARLAESGVDPTRLAVIVGTGLGGAETQDASYRRMYRDGATRVPPTSIAWSMYNAAASAVATELGAKGAAYSVVSACASSAHAIGQAFHAVRRGDCDIAIAGGADAPLAFGIIRAWESMRVLAVDNDNPAAACRPFSADRKGLVLAEGAAILILESFENAQRRGAAVIGEIVGFGITSDAGHLTDPSSDGAARAMRLAIDDAGVTPDGVDYINAHGTGTKANDATETAAIKAVFGARVPPVSSTKSMHGHAMGASGAIEIVSSIVALQAGFLPPTINLTASDPACDLDYVANASRPTEARLFLSNSFGFGGMNGVVAVRVSGP